MDGSFDGIIEMVGCIDGLAVGSIDGSLDGMSDGILLGSTDGSIDGITVIHYVSMKR